MPLNQGFPTPGLRTGSGPQPVRNRATQQEVSGGWASEASSAALHRSPSLALLPEPSPAPPSPWKNCLPWNQSLVLKTLGTAALNHFTLLLWQKGTPHLRQLGQETVGWSQPGSLFWLVKFKQCSCLTSILWPQEQNYSTTFSSFLLYLNPSFQIEKPVFLLFHLSSFTFLSSTIIPQFSFFRSTWFSEVDCFPLSRTRVSPSSWRASLRVHTPGHSELFKLRDVTQVTWHHFRNLWQLLRKTHFFHLGNRCKSKPGTVHLQV